MKRKQSAATTNLPEREWNFWDCPKDGIQDYWLYEFARELEWLKDLVERLRRPMICKTGAQVRVDTLSTFAHGSGYSFLLRPDWPAQPYLAAEREERKKWITWARGYQTQQESLADGLVAFEVPSGIERALAESLEDFGRPRFRSEDNSIELVLMRINWLKPDSLLNEEFDSYIKTFRPMIHSQQTTSWENVA